uniref:Conotoxin Cl9.1 n=1 Tax=Californiconus californicus TaxID=1736779 RepID=CM91_CONCL
MMGKLGVVLFICLVLFPLETLQLEGGQQADRHVDQLEGNPNRETRTIEVRCTTMNCLKGHCGCSPDCGSC